MNFLTLIILITGLIMFAFLIIILSKLMNNCANYYTHFATSVRSRNNPFMISGVHIDRGGSAQNTVRSNTTNRQSTDAIRSIFQLNNMPNDCDCVKYSPPPTYSQAIQSSLKPPSYS